ncbi:MAG: hypothetical protein AMXMBFR58_17460 [Phycisphaerae bacterium]
MAMAHFVWVNAARVKVVIAALAALLCTPQSLAQPALTFRFDHQAILDHPLQFSFDRDALAITDDGQWAAHDQPRFRRPTLLAPLPVVETVPGTYGNAAINLLAVGVAEDNTTPVWVDAEFSKGRLLVYVGSLPGPSFECSMQYNPAKGGMMDFLKQSIDDRPDEAWRPVSGVVCHGMIVLQCNVAVPGPEGWVSNRIGFATCRVADLAGPRNLWWRRHSLSDALSPHPTGVGLGAFWSMPSWWSMERDGTPPTQAWIAACDYHAAPAKDGGSFFLFPIHRSGPAAADWTAAPVIELPGRWNDPTNRSHAHAIGLTRYMDRGILALGSRGDGTGNAAVYTWTIDDQDDYDTGSTSVPDSDNWRLAGPAWNGPVVVNGTIDPSLADIQQRNKGNQFIGLCPGPTPGTFLCGSDEVSETLWITSDLSQPGAPLRFTTPYRLAQTLPLPGTGNDGPWRHYLCFHVRTPTPNALGGPYIGQLSPSQNDMDGWSNQRVIYSPDGEQWCQVWNHYENVQAPVWLAAGRIWTGSYGKHGGAGIRSIAVPDTILARPLTIAPGGRNAAAASPHWSDVGVGVSVVANGVLPPGAEPPPSVGPWYRVENRPPTPVSGSPNLGTYRLATGIPAQTREISVRLWMRQDTPQESSLADTLLTMARLRTSDSTGSPASIRSSSNSASIEISSSGQWIPVVLTTDLSTWSDSHNWGSGGGNLDLVLTNAWNLAAPASFYMAVESVSWEASPPYLSQVDADLPHERAEISGFSMPDSWTVFIAGKMPDASWDSSRTVNEPDDRPIFSVISQTGLSWVDVLAGRAQSEIIVLPGGLAAGDRATVSPFNWWPGSPVYLAVTYCSQWNGFIVRGSVGNTPIRSSFPAYGALDSPAARIRFGSGDGQRITEFDIFGGAVAPGEATQTDAEAVFQAVPMLRGDPLPLMTGDCTDMYNGPCAADFDGTGFIDTDDYDAFIRAFEAGDESADFDNSGFVDTDDFDAFVLAFERGC